MGNNILNYISIGIFLVVLAIAIFYRKNSCDKTPKYDTKKYTLTQQDKEFLGKEVYQNVPLINYNYLVNYPDGPFSWGEWSWGRNNKEKSGSNYSTIFENQNSDSLQFNRNINN